MIKAETGEEMRKVMGSNIEMEATGPSPGRTPTSVPMKTPIRQRRRLKGWKEIEKPYRIPSIISIKGLPI
jgi:hypothetical protein